jgi:predicted GNAT family acetyltransferase
MPIEILDPVSAEEKILQDHFASFYRILAENKSVPDAIFEESYGTFRCLSGLTERFYNAVIGAPKNSPKACIQEQKKFFQEKNFPFVWFLTTSIYPSFEKALMEEGFQNIGTFKGVIGSLPKLQEPIVPIGYTLERIEDEAALTEFNDLLCGEFDLQETTKGPLKKALLDFSGKYMYHYGVRKEGKLVSILSTFIEGNLVSFWNTTTLSEERKKGLSTALLTLALKDATQKGCTTGASYLMTDGMALGICEKLGYETQWEFHLFLAP